jgi:hypothetical protein
VADLLLKWSVLSLAWVLPIAALLCHAAWKRPRYWSLTLLALLTVGISLLELAYVFAATNALLGYPVPQEVAQLTFRIAAFVVALFPPLFWWVYATGRFRDGIR